MSAARTLTESECQRLLRAGTFGRLGFTTPDGPLIVPMNYRVADDAVVVRVAADSQAARWAPGAAVVFEVDLVDHERWRGWSVLAHGVAAPGTGPAPTPSPRPWADGERDVVLQLAWTRLTGVQLGAGWDPLAAMPARVTP